MENRMNTLFAAAGALLKPQFQHKTGSATARGRAYIARPEGWRE
jgi:hypothetical protein